MFIRVATFIFIASRMDYAAVDVVVVVVVVVHVDANVVVVVVVAVVVDVLSWKDKSAAGGRQVSAVEAHLTVR